MGAAGVAPAGPVEEIAGGERALRCAIKAGGGPAIMRQAAVAAAWSSSTVIASAGKPVAGPLRPFDQRHALRQRCSSKPSSSSSSGDDSR